MATLATKERNRWNRRRHKLLDSQRFVASEWQHVIHDLYRERGVWGPVQPCALDKWMLDALEGPSRMRRRLKANPTFYNDYSGEGDSDTASSSGASDSAQVFFIALICWYILEYMSVSITLTSVLNFCRFTANESL